MDKFSMLLVVLVLGAWVERWLVNPLTGFQYAMKPAPGLNVPSHS